LTLSRQTIEAEFASKVTFRGSPVQLTWEAAMELLNVTLESAGRQVVVRPRGELDMATADHLARILDAALRPVEVSRLELDMSGVRFMDWSGLRVLLHAKQRLDKEGGALTLTHVTPQVDRLLSILRLDHSLNPVDRHQLRRIPYGPGTQDLWLPWEEPLP
jgi:anti-anti-sigma factor